MYRTEVRVEGTTSVALAGGAMKTMVELGDGALQEEVASEALRLGVAQKLAGFEGVELRREAAGPVARVDFDGLSACIAQLLKAHDTAVDRLDRLGELLAPVDAAALPAEARAAVEAAAEILRQAKADADAPAIPPPAPEKQNGAAGAGEAARSASPWTDSSAASVGDDGGSGPDRAGYRLLADSDDEQDGAGSAAADE